MIFFDKINRDYNINKSSIIISLEPLPLTYSREGYMGADITYYPFRLKIIESTITTSIQMFDGLIYMMDDDYDNFKSDPYKFCVDNNIISVDDTDNEKTTDKDEFIKLFNKTNIRTEITEDGIYLDSWTCGGNGHLFIKFYEDGKFNKIMHYADQYYFDDYNANDNENNE